MTHFKDGSEALSLRLSKAVLKRIDEMTVSKRGLPIENRSQAIRYLIFLGLEEYQYKIKSKIPPLFSKDTKQQMAALQTFDKSRKKQDY